MKSHIRRALAEAERRNEELTAYARIGVFISLAAVFLVLRRGFPALPLTAPLIGFAGYFLLSVVSIVLARLRYFRPWLLWLFATLDVAFLVFTLTTIADALGVATTDALRGPGGSIVFLFLALAAMRYRPGLTLYIMALFAACWAVLMMTGGETIIIGRTRSGDLMVAPAAIEAVRLAVAGLTAAVLALAVHRSRQVLIRASVEARSKRNLSKYVSPNLIEQLADAGIGITGESRRQMAGVIFIDVRGFTAMSERMSPEAVTAFLTEYRRRMTAPIYRHFGTLDKFIGDGIMAIFGTPEPRPDDAHNALLCGIGLVEALEAWNRDRADRALAPVQIGIGIHFGEVVAGALGDENRLEYTVIGDTVNVAERIEEMTRDNDECLLVSGELLTAAGALPANVATTPIAAAALRGKKEAVRLFSVRVRRAE